MCYGVYYYIMKFQLKTPTMHGEMKKQITVGVIWAKWYSLGAKMNQTIVYRVIQTLATVERSNLNFFLQYK